MPVLKPIRGIRLNKSHPLARGLVGYWLLNEGSGNKVFDLSGNGCTGTFVADTSWISGKFGSALNFDAVGDYVQIAAGNFPNISAGGSLTICGWVNLRNSPSNDYKSIFGFGDSGDNPIISFSVSSAEYLTGFLETDTSDQIQFTGDGTKVVIGVWTFIALIIDRNNHQAIRYINGLQTGSIDDISAQTGSISHLNNVVIGKIGRIGEVADIYWDGQIDNVSVYNRALSASEIALFYREPFCMFDRAWRPLELGGQIVELAGTSAALSSLSAIAKVSRKVGGTIVGTSNVDGSLGIIGGQIVELAGTIAGRSNVNGSLGIMGESPPEMERSWLTEALFNGMTANAFKLGTSLSLGWFWVRVTGCSVLYRGTSMGDIGGVDFANILTVSEQDAREISPPTYIPHDGSPNGASTYFYVVRRFNNCGYQELTLAAAVKVVFDGFSGELAKPQPNNIFSSKVEQVASNKIRLAWFYCPLEQGSKPICFNVYYDDRTGQIDYLQTPLATISYKGRKFYSFQSSALEAGKYLFAIRAEDAGGIENISLARLKIQLDTLNPDAIDILRAEAV